MAVKAVAVLYFVNSDSTNTGKFKANIAIAGIDPTPGLVDTSVFLDNIDPGITAVNLEAAIKQRVKDELTNNYGYTFGIFDTVRLIGALL